MDYTTVFLYRSNQWYNDGLKKADIRDLSGAEASLRRSLWYNRDNVAARNLLGLVYYGKGEVCEALVQWIISKNIQSHENIAAYFIKRVQGTPNDLELINQAAKKYNQCLDYCRQGSEDLAIIQLNKVISMNPVFLRAYQLLALLYIQTGQRSKARQILRRAYRLDVTNVTTLRYMHELSLIHGRDKAQKDGKKQSVSYQMGNETIIQPVSSTLKDSAPKMTVLNIVTGVVVGVVLVWFLMVPAVRQNMAKKARDEAVSYSEQIASLKSQIDLLEQDIDKYKADSEATAAEIETAKNTKNSYEGLVSAINHARQENYDRAALADELLAIDASSLGEVGKTVYDDITKDVFEEQCEKLYESAARDYDAGNYKSVTEKMERAVKMREGYENGRALLLLLKAYQKTGDLEHAAAVNSRITELFPGSDVAKEAADFINGTER